MPIPQLNWSPRRGVCVMGFDTSASIELQNRRVECPQKLRPLGPDNPEPEDLSNFHGVCPWYFSSCSLLDIQELRLCERPNHYCHGRVVIGMMVRYRSGLQVTIGQVRLDSLRTTLRIDPGEDQAALAFQVVTTSAGLPRGGGIISGLDVLSHMRDSTPAMKVVPLKGSLTWWFREFSCVIDYQDEPQAGHTTRILRGWVPGKRWESG